MGKPRKYREVVKTLRKHEPRFEFWEDRGKGSKRIIYPPDLNGRPASIPVKCHGEGTELRKGIISASIRRFNLPDGLL